MLYSIIPPILVVLSVIGVILLLMRKVPEINKLEEQEEMDDRLARTRMVGDRSVSSRLENSGGSKIKSLLNFVFLALGKMVKLFQAMLSGLQNIFKSWSDAIQNKGGVRQTKEEKLANIQNIVEEEEKIVRPFISDKVVTPVIDDSRKKEIKERLEEILIERIAANPKDLEAYERLGEYYMEIGNLDHSKECFKQVIKLDPGNRSVKYKIRKLERLLGN